ncbi:hypothetical protein ACSTS3_21245 [Aquimarina muelleri]|uniref:hypothetical protein n=1 Tax=Aquimarina muelleri TaxID=279356 RepID=UPI003F688AE5
MDQIDHREIERRRLDNSSSPKDCKHSKYSSLEETSSGNRTGKYLCSNCYHYHEDKYYAIVQMESKNPDIQIFKCNKFDLILDKICQKIEYKLSSIVKDIAINPKEFREDWEWKGFHFTATTLRDGVNEEKHLMYFRRIALSDIEF